MAIRTALNYAMARRRWIKAGRPVRSDEQIAKLLEVCRKCEHYAAISESLGKCTLCGCRLNLGRRLNKLAWATETCPVGRWTETNEGETSMDDPTVLSREARRQAPDVVKLPVNSDPLVVYAKDGSSATQTLRNLWSPSAAFLIGSGPSLNNVPLEMLKERGIASLAINNAAGYAPARAMVFADPPEKFHHGIFFDPAMIKFAPHTKRHKRVRAKVGDRFRWTKYNVGHCPATFFYLRGNRWAPRDFFRTNEATWGIGKAQAAEEGREALSFTFLIGLRLMHFLGVRRVYLLGVDFHMRPGERYVGAYAFAQAGHGFGNNDHYRISRDMLLELQPAFEEAGFRVYNCNPDSRLDLYPFVPFERALEDCRGAVPREPFDLSGWYEKAEEFRQGTST